MISPVVSLFFFAVVFVCGIAIGLVIRRKDKKCHYDRAHDLYIVAGHKFTAPTVDMLDRMADREDIVELKKDERGAILMRVIEINYVKG